MPMTWGNDEKIPGADIVLSLFRDVLSPAGKHVHHFMEIVAVHAKRPRQVVAVCD